MVSLTMFTISSLTILLCLFLCTNQLKISSDPLQRGSPRPVKIDCLFESGESKLYGVFWFRHKKGATSPESIVHISTTGRETYNKDYKTNFKATLTDIKSTLSTDKFDETDQGTYYCMINKNSVLYISPGLRLFYPEVTTPKPKLTKPPPARTTDAGGPCNCPTASKDPEPLGLSCDLSVWAPLAGICGVFLICLLITSIMLCCRTRRRICRCNPRPTDERNGHLNLAKRQI